MQKYSIFNLIKNAFSGHQNWDLAWKDPTPKKEYDVVIIGGRWSSLVLSSCLVLYAPRAGRTLLAGEDGSAVGQLPPSHHPKSTWACLWCRPPPEFPCPSAFCLGLRLVKNAVSALSAQTIHNPTSCSQT